MTEALVAGAIVLFGGIVLLALGLRGRRTDAHPICRKCGFDLFGLDQATRCPECGTELSAGAIRVGHRRVRRRMLAGGIVLALPAVALVATIITLNVRKTNFETIKPVWWLLRDDDAAAASELYRRLGLKMLSPGQISQVTEAALRWQADPKHPWVAGWGDFIEAARSTGDVTDEQWHRYAQNAVTITFEARPEVRRGDKLPVRVTLSKARTSNRTDNALNLRIMHATVDELSEHLGGLLPENAGGGGNVIFVQNIAPPYSSDDVLVPTPSILAALADGPHQVHADLRLEMRHQMAYGTARPVDQVEWHQSLTENFTLAPPDQPTVTFAPPSDELARLVHIAAHAGGRGSGFARRTLTIETTGISLEIGAINPPVGLAFDVFLRDPQGQEWLVGRVHFQAGKNNTWFFWAMPNDLKADQLDIVLRSNPAIAAETVDLSQIWQGELVYRALPLIWSEGVARPTKFDGGTPPTSRPTATTRGAP